MSIQKPTRSDMSSHSDLYFHTDRLQPSMKGSTP